MTKHYTVKFEKPGNQFIEPGTETDLSIDGTKIMVGKLEGGCWLSWMPFYEKSHNRQDGESVRVVSDNKYVAAGVIKDFYYD